MTWDEHEELCLFLGGEHDGERHRVRVASMTWDIARRTPVYPSPFTLTADRAPALERVRYSTYKRMQWRGEWNLRYIYCEPTMDAGDVLNKLIDGYNKGSHD
jgi:hypothetical protein